MLLEHSNVVSRVPVEIFGRSEYQKLLHPNAIQCHDFVVRTRCSILI